MIKIGKVQLLEVEREAPFGIFLSTGAGHNKEEVLLPSKEVPGGIQPGHRLEVFVYRDSKDRPIATRRKPKAQVGDLVVLPVVSTAKIGAFLDWGLERDLFLPFREQVGRPQVGQKCLVAVYTDKSDRLCATMDVYKYLESDSPYEKDASVEGTVIQVKDLGAFVAIDNKYHGLIPKQEIFQELKPGDTIKGRVSKVREDGKLNISIREKAHVQMDQDSLKIFKQLVRKGGFMQVNDKSDPDVIKKEFGMSKKAFKRAIGRLLKEEKIQFINDGIGTK